MSKHSWSLAGLLLLSTAAPSFAVDAFDDVAASAWRKTPIEASSSSLVEDVDGDGTLELLIAGSGNSDWLHSDGAGRVWVGELRVAQYLSGEHLDLLAWKTWPGTGYAYVSDLATGDIDGDGRVEIVTAGSTSSFYFDKTIEARRFNAHRAHLRAFEWDGRRLVPDGELVWTPGRWPAASLSSVAIEDVDGDGTDEIICGGHATDDDKRLEEAWFDVIEWPTLTIKGREIWPQVQGQWAELDDLAVADVDADGKLEIVTAAHLSNQWDPQSSILQADAELIAWSIQAGDPFWTIQQDARVAWRAHVSDFTAPQELWIGNLDNEAGIDVVTVGIARKGPLDDFEWLDADIRMFRFGSAGVTLANNAFYCIMTSSGAHWKSEVKSVTAADIDGDGGKELLVNWDLALPGRPAIGYITAMNPNVPWMPADPEDADEWVNGNVWERTRSFEICDLGDAPENGKMASDGACAARANTRQTSIRAADIDGDGKIETIVSGTYEYPGRTGVFAFAWR